jgi:hypothetical protein
MAGLIATLRALSPGMAKSVERAANSLEPVGRAETSIERSIVYFGDGVSIMQANDSVGAKFGDNANVAESNFLGQGQQNVANASLDALASFDLALLAQELHRLREVLKSSAGNSDDRVALEVGQARDALQQGDSTRAVSHLRAAGRWALKIAESIGAQVAASAIKAALGI